MPAFIMNSYFLQPPACLDYDPRAAEVAQRVTEAITSFLPMVMVEHIGSTAVPGCAGKGVVDLMVLYPEGQLEATRKTLDALGLQRQTAGHLFSESRPMRVGALEHNGRMFRVHVHVIAANSPEAAALRTFRERLRGDAEIMAAYVARKRAILAASVTDHELYTRMKGAFVRQTLAASGNPSLVPAISDWTEADSLPDEPSRQRARPHRARLTGARGGAHRHHPDR